MSRLIGKEFDVNVGAASGIFDIRDVTNYIEQSKWPDNSPDPYFNQTPLLLKADTALSGGQNNTFIDNKGTNLLTYSEQFDNAAWTKSNATITSNTVVSPDGTLDADKLVEDATNNLHFTNQSATATTSAATTFSFFAKAAERTVVLVHFADPASLGNRAEARFNLSSGTTSNVANVGTATGAIASITSVGNGWYRCVLTATINSGTSAMGRCFLIDGSGNATYTGDGYSGLYIWGAQLEPTSSASTYQPTGANVSTPFTITRNGNPAQGSFSPYGDMWSHYLDGNGDLLTFPSSSAFDLSTGPNTIEFWLYPTALPGAGNSCRVLMFGTNDTTNAFYVGFLQSGELLMGVPRTGYVGLVTAANTVELHKWQHFALIQNGANSKIYKNGVEVASGNVQSPTAGNINLKIGYDTVATVNFQYVGFISNVRILKSALVYTGNFTPPTAPLTAVPGTALLTCQGNRFRDNSSNNFSVTISGNVSVQRFSPFAGIAPVTPYYSGYFDGNGDFLSVAHNTALNLASGDFTIEAFFFPTTFAKEQMIAIKDHTFGTTFWSYKLSATTSGKAQISLFDGAGAITPGYDLSSDQSIDLNRWNHIAATRSGTTIYIFVNGVGKSGTQSGTQRDGGKQLNIGRIQTGASTFDDITGYISNLRIVKGTALYTANFTPPTGPLSAVSGTSLLTCQSSSFIDNSTNNFAITINGNTAPSTFQPFAVTYSFGQSYDPTVYGGGGYLDGTGDYLSFASAFLFSGTAFTFELWFYPFNLWTFTRGAGSGSSNTVNLYMDTGNTIRFDISGTTAVLTTAAGVITLNAWNHLAFVKNGTSYTVYVNGVSVGTATNSTTLIGNSTLFLNTFNSTATANGFFSDIRYNTTALYTRNFIPPSAPLTAVENTALLMNCTNAAIFDSAMMNFSETVGNAQVSTTVKKYGLGSMYFDGTGDRIVITPDNMLVRTWWDSDITIEYWVYGNAWSSAGNGNSTVLAHASSGNTDEFWSFGPISTGVVRFYWWSGAGNFLDTPNTLLTGVWNHVAFTKQGTTLRIFVNGVPYVSTTLANTPQSGSTLPVMIGTGASGTSFNGYVDDLRVTKGIARYTTSFTPPGPLPTR